MVPWIVTVHVCAINLHMIYGSDDNIKVHMSMLTLWTASGQYPCYMWTCTHTGHKLHTLYNFSRLYTVNT